jgi:hypothetical protein
LKYRLDEDFRIAERQRTKARLAQRQHIETRIRAALKQKPGGLSLSWIEALFGYGADDVRRRIESTFTEGMNWDAFHCGLIHIDHIVPMFEFIWMIQMNSKQRGDYLIFVLVGPMIT